MLLLDFVSKNSEEEHFQFIEYSRSLEGSANGSYNHKKLPEWLLYQPKIRNVYDRSKLGAPSPFDVVIGKFDFRTKAGKENKEWLQDKDQVLSSSFKTFNGYLRNILKLYANELSEGYPKGQKIGHSQTLAVSNGILMTFPYIHEKYCHFLHQEHTGEATFKETTLKPYAQVGMYQFVAAKMFNIFTFFNRTT